MADDKMMRLLQVAKRLNVGISTIADYLNSKGFRVENNPNSKINTEQFNMLVKEFESSMATKKEASNLTIGKTHNENIVIKSDKPGDKKKSQEEEEIFIRNHYPVETANKDTKKNPATQKDQKKEEEVIKAKLPGLKVVDKIDLENLKKGKTSVEEPVKVIPPEEKPAAELKPVVENPPVAKVVEEKKTPVEPTPPVIEQKPVAEVQVTPALNEEKPSLQETTPVQPSSDQPAVTKEPEFFNINTTSTQNTLVDTPEDAYEQRRMVKVADVIKADAQKKDKEKEKSSAQESSSTTEPNTNNEVIEAKAEKLQGLTVLGKIELPVKSGKKKVKPVASSDDSSSNKEKNKRKRKRIRNGNGGTGTTTTPNTNANVVANKDQGQGTAKPRDPNSNNSNNSNRPVQRPDQKDRPPFNRDNNNRPNQNPQGQGGHNRNPSQVNRNTQSTTNPVNRNLPPKGKPQPTAEVTDKQIQDQIKNTLARLSSGKNKQALRRQNKKDKRMAFAKKQEQMLQEQEESNKTLKVTEFISANDLASLLDVSVNEIISKCLSFGMFVSINQRLDAEAITIIADEFGFDVEFTTAEQEIAVSLETTDDDADLEHRAPIVTIMGHVDHGKTSLLDYIRRTKVVEGEAGGITQHIGAYDVKTNSGKRITFLDTPGHEAFTAMRARGAKVTDVVIIVIAADDSVMPQTKEAINHAQVAGVPIVIAINKVDKPNANPAKIREELAKLNLLVESWGGKYQEQEISAKMGTGVEELLEKVLLEAEILDLKANPHKNAVGTVIESSLDKGRGYVTTLLVQAGALHVGDIILAGANYGKVKAMTDHTGKRLTKVGPSTPVQILGINGAPQAGDKFNVLDTEREAREIATKREQILREQSLRTTKRITLSDLGRRILIGAFKQLNIIVKGDVDGSVEALSDSLLKLSTEEIEVNIIHKAVGQISESDVLLATASDAIIVGFQVRPSASARKLAEKEQIEIRLYSIIYDAINEVRDAMEGMLAPSIEEVIIGNAQVRETFKINKIGTVAGCYVLDGVIKRNARVRVIRDGIVVFGGGDHGAEISALKRFKDDVNEVKFGYECGLSVKNFNDIRVDDTIECYEQREVKRKLV